MNCYVRGLAVLLLAAGAADAQLPVKRVVLYKNGVGYFEHLGQVRGNQDVAIPFTSGQLNDVLKSLTVLDQGGGRITGVAYGSSAPIDRQLGDLRLPLGERSSLTEFLGSLRGARLEIKSGTTTLTGRLLSIEHKTRIAGNVSLDVDYVSLLGDHGEVRTADLSPGFSVRLLDAALPGRLDRYLDIVSAGREPDVRRMIVSTEGTGDRSLFVSYISEVPVWKSTYRIVLGKSSRAPLLQGWAIVDNTVGQDWENVQLSLVAGAPQSFVQNLSQPYYSRRPEIGMPDTASASPQTYQATLNTNGDFSHSEQYARMQPGVVNVQGTPGTLETQTAMANTVQIGSANVGSGSMLGSGNYPLNGRVLNKVPVSGLGSGGGVGGGTFALPSAAAARELGDLFEYKLKDPITIRKNNSAMVPIVQSEIAAEKVSVWNERTNLPRPMRALWLTNTTGLTLDGGSFSVMEDETFAGEGVFEPIRPKERRLVSYAIDLALNVSSKNSSEAQRVTRVRILRGVMTHEAELRERKTYTFRNEDSTARSVIIEHPVRPGYKLRGEAQPIETTADWLRFRVGVEPKQTAMLEIEEARPLANTYQLTNLDGSQVELFVRQGSINTTIERELRRILAQKDAVAELDSKKDDIDEVLKHIYDDQQRLRENIKSLKGSTEEKLLLQRYTQQMNDQETRLDNLRKEMEQLTAKHEAASAALDKMIQDLSFDVTI
jgi:hypothetical protein